MRENPLVAGAPPRTPLGGAYSVPQTLPRPYSWWGCPFTENFTPALGPSGLQPWPFGPRSLPPQIRLPKSACELHWTYFYSPLVIPYVMLYYNINPNSLRPYHTTLGPAAVPTCSKILAPPLTAPACYTFGTGTAALHQSVIDASVDKVRDARHACVLADLLDGYTL